MDPPEKKKDTTESNKMKFFRKTAGTPFLTTKGMEKFWKI